MMTGISTAGPYDYLQCHGAAAIDPHYDAYPECARQCLACPDYSWTYQGSNCAERLYNSSVPTPCCPVPEHPWRAYYPEVWECVWKQCESKSLWDFNHDAAQAALVQYGSFCADEMKQPLYEYWKGIHFHGWYKMEGFGEYTPPLRHEPALK